MELNSGIQISSRSGFGGAQQSSMIMAEGSQSQQFARPSRAAADIEEGTMWQMNFRLNEEPMESSASYPERPGEHDCAYYIRTGLCRFGATCRFNHPPNRRLAVAAARIKGGYPERIGQPECQYYLKTGTCKFGATCKFHHPRDKAGIAGRVMLNVLGYPLRPNEKECTYYLRTGQCKYGNTCKFHHPQPTSAMVSLRDSTVYPPVHSPSTPSQQSYPGGLPNWSLSRASFVQSPRWQGPSNYAQVILPPGVVSVPGWSPYPGQLGSVSSSEGQQQGLGSSQFYGTTRQNETASAGTQGTFPSYQSGSIPIGLFPLQRENAFPERPDQPECQFYMKTGDCKFGAGCRFHHPRERLIPVPNCVLSPLGLPLRPGEPLCVFYSRYGICKFGPTCKFDHPMGTFAYGLTASSADVPIVRRLLGSSTSGNPALPALASEASVEGKSRRLLLSETRQISPGEESIETEGGSHPTSSIGPASSFP